MPKFIKYTIHTILIIIFIINCIDGLPCDSNENKMHITYQDFCFLYINHYPLLSDFYKIDEFNQNYYSGNSIKLNEMILICLLAIEERKKEEDNKKNLCGIGKRWPKL
ncbi:MAG: hypothetical protein KatS3mg129_2336 [Leptospiraceae bacterium]|nr:MAG: hypothetical protein KatS3mg129_2336 [Leptospiraceae bacterium]